MVSAYLFVSLRASPRGHIAVPQLDSLIYQQYARALAEGHPYRFNPEDPPSTGSTSHLYPVLLALFYAVGFKGPALWDAAFVLHAVLYLFFLNLVFRIAREVLPSSAPFAAAAVALSGQTAAVFFGQTDMGLFAVLFFWLWVMLARHRYGAAGVLLFLLPLARPEGAVVGGVLLSVALAAGLRDREQRRLTAAALAGIAGACLVAGVNLWLTGSPFFDSLRGKNLFVLFPFWTAMSTSVSNFVELLKALLLGIGAGGRGFYNLPLVGIFLLGAAVIRGWDCPALRNPLGRWLLGSVLVTLIGVASSDWAGLMLDRYLVWIEAVVILLVAVGTYCLPPPTEVGKGAWRAGMVLRILLAAWLAAGSLWHLAAFADRARRTTAAADFAKKATALMKSGEAVGMTCDSGLAYVLEDHPVVNLSGVVTPAFRGQGHLLSALEWLKYHPAARFGYWLVPRTHAPLPWLKPLLGRRLTWQADPSEAEPLVLYEAVWTALDRLGAPAPDLVPQGWECTGRLDVGYRPDEIAAYYGVHTREPDVRLDPVVVVRGDTDPVVEIGRFVMGQEWYSLRVRGGRPLKIVLRTARRFTVPFYASLPRMELREVELNRVIRLRVIGAGRAAEHELDLGEKTGVVDRVIDFGTVPPDVERLQVDVIGDHLSLAYWFYQPSSP